MNFVQDLSDVRGQIGEVRSTLADKGALTGKEIHNTLDKLVQVAEKLTSQLSDVDRAMQAAEKLALQVSDIENRVKRMEEQTAGVRHKSGP
jgi:predicted  nucleic acid-binding Zn-ribbon protein